MSNEETFWAKRKSPQPLIPQGITNPFNGADNRIRTGDLFLTKEVLYLLSYISTSGGTTNILYMKSSGIASIFRKKNPPCTIDLHSLGSPLLPSPNKSELLVQKRKYLLIVPKPDKPQMYGVFHCT